MRLDANSGRKIVRGAIWGARGGGLVGLEGGVHKLIRFMTASVGQT